MIAPTFEVRRTYIGLALIGLLAALAGRLAWIQAVRHQFYGGLAARMERDEIVIEAQRGDILDSRGMRLALNRKVPSVCINPRQVAAADVPQVASSLANALSLDRAALEAKLANNLRYFAWVARKVTPEQAQKVADLQIRGVFFRDETQRQYPHGTRLAHTLGFVGVDGRGLAGIEARFDSILAGTPGRETVMRDGRAQRLPINDGYIAPVHGQSLVLTIDHRIQSIVEEELAAACAKHRPSSACAVAMDPWTGDVLAMANWPAFDPAQFQKVPESVRQNMAVSECLEPGSSFKPFLAATAIDLGLVTPETKFDCHHGAFRMAGRTLHDAHGYGILTVRDIIAYSSNIGIAQVGGRMTPAQIYRALSSFGFGRPTGIELPGESAGLLHHPRGWSRLTISSVPMGQEVAVSPVQLAAGFSVFANGGWHVKPRLIRGVADAEGKIVVHAPKPTYQRVLSEKTAKVMVTDLMARVMEYGTARAAAIQGIPSAGKTGTAQIARVGGGGYEPGAYTAVFAGIAPTDIPRVVIVMMAKKPRGGSNYGGVVAAPAVSKMMERTLSMWGLPRTPQPAAGPRGATARANAH